MSRQLFTTWAQQQVFAVGKGISNNRPLSMTIEEQRHNVTTPNESTHGRKYKNMHSPSELSSPKVLVLKETKDILRRTRHRI